MKFDISAAIRITERCNFSCQYCYVAGERKATIDIKTVENIIKKLFAYNHHSTHFGWIGGEPLLMPDKYFEEIINLSNKHNLKRLKVSHSIETNGSLLTEDRREFLQKLGFKIGISYDGIKKIHDQLRRTNHGDKTHYAIIKNLLEANKLVGTISVLTSLSHNHESEIYQELTSLTKSASLNLYTPCGNSLTRTDTLLPSKGQARDLLLKFYELWRGDKNSFQLNPFSEIVKSFFIGNNNICEYSVISCYRILGINVDGTIYPCLRSVHLPETSMGNINIDEIEKVLQSEVHEAILDRYFKLKDECCKYLSLCGGGCPMELLQNGTAFNGRTYYCEAKKALFEQIEGNLKNDKIRRNLESRVFG